MAGNNLRTSGPNTALQSRPAPGGSFSFPGLEASYTDAPTTQAPSADAPYSSSRPAESSRSNPGAQALAAAANAMLASPSPSSGKRSVRIQPSFVNMARVPQTKNLRRDANNKDWRWCLGGKEREVQKSSVCFREAETTYKELGRSESEPNFHPGSTAEPFYGEPRDFGLGVR